MPRFEAHTSSRVTSGSPIGAERNSCTSTLLASCGTVPPGSRIYEQSVQATLLLECPNARGGEVYVIDIADCQTESVLIVQCFEDWTQYIRRETVNDGSLDCCSLR